MTSWRSLLLALCLLAPWGDAAATAVGGAPLAHIATPGDSDEIEVADMTAPIAITGTASDRNFAEYELLISPSGKEQWTRLALGTSSVTGGTLGDLNPQAIANGLYDIGLVVRDLAGKEAKARITIAIVAQQKAAPLRLTFEDMAFELEGLPLGVTRSYDSLRRFEHLDFGYGWSVQWQDATVQTNGIVGRLWSTLQTGSGFNLAPPPLFLWGCTDEKPRVQCAVG